MLRILYDSRLLFKSGILLTFALGIDIGTADLIIKGRVKIKSGTQPDHFVSDGVVFKDGSSLKADLVVFATGYEPVKDNVRGIFGEELATKVTPIWNMDEEGECRRTYTPSGQPGVSLANVRAHDEKLLSIISFSCGGLMANLCTPGTIPNHL